MGTIYFNFFEGKELQLNLLYNKLSTIAYFEHVNARCKGIGMDGE